MNRKNTNPFIGSHGRTLLDWMHLCTTSTRRESPALAIHGSKNPRVLSLAVLDGRKWTGRISVLPGQDPWTKNTRNLLVARDGR